MKTLMFRKIRLGWELVLDGKVIAHRVTATARGDILLLAAGVVMGYAEAGVALKIADDLAFFMREKGLYKEKPLAQA